MDCGLWTVESGLWGVGSEMRDVKRKRGFTLLELLVVVVIMAVLMGLLLPAVLKAKNQSKVRRSEVQVKALGSAIDGFILEHHHLPAPTKDLRTGDDYYYGTEEPSQSTSKVAPGSDYPEYGGENSKVFQVLLGSKPKVLKADIFNVDSRGNVVDPWGKPYRFYLDLNNDRWIDYVRFDANGDRVGDSNLGAGARNENEDPEEYVRYVIKRTY